MPTKINHFISSSISSGKYRCNGIGRYAAARQLSWPAVKLIVAEQYAVCPQIADRGSGWGQGRHSMSLLLAMARALLRAKELSVPARPWILRSDRSLS